MKKILSVVMLFCTGSISSAFASTDFITFTTVAQAEQYCPMANSLSFIPNNPSISNSAGTIRGTKGTVFESIPPKTAINPKNKDINGLIADAQFRNANDIYGYISNNTVTCLYSYTTFINGQYALILQGNKA